MSTAALKPFWSYYGGKFRAAPRYPQPVYDTIVEPFAGAAGYALRYYDRDVVLVDKYEAVAGVWRYLIAASESEIRSIPIVDRVDDLAAWPQEVRWLVGFTMGAAIAVPMQQTTAGCLFQRDRGVPIAGGWTEERRSRVAQQVSLIRHWRIICGDYTAAPDIVATWFVDPPYQTQGVYYKHSSKDIDFRTLGSWCTSRRGQTIVCENDGADWLPFEHFGDIKSSAMSGRGGVSGEAIWMRQSSTAEWFSRSGMVLR